MSRKRISTTLLLLLIPCLLLASKLSITGVVLDNENGETLIGAVVYLKEDNRIRAITGLDGTFTLSNLPSGQYTLECSYIGYDQFSTKITFPASSNSFLTIPLSPSALVIDGSEVIARAEQSDSRARLIEKLSPQVLNIVSANSIEHSPDLTVANVLQRVSGVTLERNSSGEAQYAVLRGMDKRYNISLVNGVKIASPDNKQRYIPLDIFPSELLQRLEVSKTRTADKEGDATGGAVNMVMKDAPSSFSLNINTSIGYNALFFERDFTKFDPNRIIKVAPYEQYGKEYRASIGDLGNGVSPITKSKSLPNGVFGISAGGRVLKNKLGILVAANVQSRKKGANSSFYEDEMLQTERSVRLTSFHERLYSEDELKLGVHAKFDYVFNKNHQIELYNAYIYNNNQQVRESNSTNLKLHYEPEKGNGDYSYQTRFRVARQQILTSTLMGNHNFTKAFNLEWKLVYSDARNNRPDQTYINIDNLRTNYIDNIYVDADGSPRRWEHNKDSDYSALLNLNYDLDLKKKGKLSLQWGGLFKDKKRDNFYVSYTMKPLGGSQRQGVDYNTIDEIKWTLYMPYGSVGPLNYNANEMIIAAYGQAKWEWNKWEAILGVRGEYTDQGYLMVFPNAGEDPNGGQTYLDILPNFNLKYSYHKDHNLRLSYYRSINRPGFFEIVPYQMKYEEYDEYGNKNLKRAVIDNIDLRWEYFPRSTEQILVGAFYKRIESPIEYAYHSINNRQFGYMPVNLGNANNFGVEIDFIKYFNSFGVKGNYTYTNSKIVTSKAYYSRDNNGNIQRSFQDQARPLVGQAAHVANISLLYKSPRYGWDAQLAASYTGDRIVIASHYLDSDYWQKGGVQLDASVEKKFENGISIFAKAGNLLNTPLVEYIKTTNDYNSNFPLQSKESGITLIRRDFYLSTFLIGLKYKLK